MTAIVVPVVPVAQPRARHRAFEAGGKLISQTYLPADNPVNAYKAALRLAWGQATDAPPLDGPVYVKAEFVFPRPASRRRKATENRRLEHVTKPDIDNLIKSTLDALTGLAWRDDKQVWSVEAIKTWGTVHEQPRAIIYVSDRR